MSPLLSVTRVGTARVVTTTRAAAARVGALPTLDILVKPGGSTQSVTSSLPKELRRVWWV